jgi:hypothetical protein
VRHIDVAAKEINYNPKFDELFAPAVGPENPFKTDLQKAHKNILSGFVEKAHISDFQFETQMRTFHTYGMFFLALKTFISVLMDSICRICIGSNHRLHQ